jgi:hypothetical protein
MLQNRTNLFVANAGTGASLGEGRYPHVTAMGSQIAQLTTGDFGLGVNEDPVASILGENGSIQLSSCCLSSIIILRSHSQMLGHVCAVS